MALATWDGNGALGSPTSDHSRRDADDRGLAVEVAANDAVAGLNLVSPAPVDRASPQFAGRGSSRPHSLEPVAVGPWGAVDAHAARAPPTEPAPIFIAPPTVAVRRTSAPPLPPRGYLALSPSRS